jgi:cyclopropane fatty-acyl-phospholipid synthase-like methyltransferase
MYKRIFIFIAVLVIILTLVIEARVKYKNMLNTCFRKDGNITYDYLIQYIQCISKGNYFMNYGLWDKKHDTLKKANQNLCDFMFSHAKLDSTSSQKRLNILDVGCGYGKQDFMIYDILVSKSPRFKITALDLSKKQVDFANKVRRRKGIPKKKLTFMEGDAHCLLEYFNSPNRSPSKNNNKKFDRILSIESAFHYKDRPLFFNSVSKLLTKDGIFVISDIMLKDTYTPTIMTRCFLDFAKDFLCIPEQNLIKAQKWRAQVEENGLKVVELYDITDKTFVPYYSHFFNKYIQEKQLPLCTASMLEYMFCTVQPFAYLVAVCVPQ